jgi:hypothetical protein
VVEAKGIPLALKLSCGQPQRLPLFRGTAGGNPCSQAPTRPASAPTRKAPRRQRL